MMERPETPGESPEVENLPTPFLFKVMVVLAALYLGWRLVEGVIWLIQVLGG
jgi:hypothetical protein